MGYQDEYDSVDARIIEYACLRHSVPSRKSLAFVVDLAAVQVLFALPVSHFIARYFRLSTTVLLAVR